MPPATIAMPFLLMTLKEWSFRGQGFSSLVGMISQRLNFRSKFWATFPRTLMKRRSLLSAPFQSSPPKLKTPSYLSWLRQVASSQYVCMILCLAMRSCASDWLCTEKMRGLRMEPPVKVMKMRSSLNFYFQLRPPLIMRVLPKRVEAWCFMFSPPRARSHYPFYKLNAKSYVLNLFPFQPSKLTPPTITMFPLQTQTV